MAKRVFLYLLKLIGVRKLLSWAWSIVLLPKLKELAANTEETDFDDKVVKILEDLVPKLIAKI